MSLVFIILAVFGVALLFSQLGGRVSARSAPAWILLLGFLLFCVITPESLRPIASFLGIQVVSNFVIAALIFFLIYQAIQESVFSTQHSRKLREMISTYAANGFSGEKKNQALVILPTYNEEKNIEQMIQRLKKTAGNFDYCFINDGSQDSTEQLLKSNKANFVTHSANIGVSGALLTGFKIAKNLGYDFVIQCDSDGQHPVDQISEMISKATQEKCDLLIGSRFMRTNADQDASTTGLRKLGSFFIKCSLRMFSSRNSMSDPTSGFRIYSKEVLPQLIKEMPEEYPEPEILALLLLKKKKIVEVPVIMNAREAGVSSISGLKSVHFMLKVTSALFGLRLRNL